MKAAIYVRVSTDEQAEDGYSLEAQERAGRLYAELRNWDVIAVYKDDGYSGRSDDRPALKQLIKDIALRKVECVIVHKLDRLARNLQLMLELINGWDKKGVGFASISEQMDFSTPMGRMVLQILGAVAEWYSNNLAKEVSKGLAEKAEQGRWVGPVSIGYQKTEIGDLVLSPDAPTIEQIYRLYVSGRYGYADIADELNAAGLRALDWRTGERRLFGRESIRTILKNHAYAGFVTSGGKEFPGNHPVIISPEVWIQAQGIRQERTVKQGRVSVGVSKETPLLSEIAYCKACGKRMWSHWSGGYGDARRPYYVCSGRDHRTCEAPFSRAIDVEAQALAELNRLTIPPSMTREILGAAEQLLSQEQATPMIDRSKIQEQLQRLGKVFQYGLMKESEFEQERARLQGMLVISQISRPVYDLHKALESFVNLSKLLDVAPQEEKRMLLRAVYSHLWIEDSELKAVTPTRQYLPLVGVLLNMGWLKGVNSPIFSKPLPIWTADRQLWTSQPTAH